MLWGRGKACLEADASAADVQESWICDGGRIWQRKQQCVYGGVRVRGCGIGAVSQRRVSAQRCEDDGGTTGCGGGSNSQVFWVG